MLYSHIFTCFTTQSLARSLFDKMISICLSNVKHFLDEVNLKKSTLLNKFQCYQAFWEQHLWHFILVLWIGSLISKAWPL